MHFYFYGHMIKRSFHTCSLWKGRKVINKVERKINKFRCRKHSLPIGIFVLCLLGDKACCTLIDLGHLRVFDRKIESRRSSSRPCWAVLTHVQCTFLTIFLGFYLLHYLVCYNVKHHAIVITLAVRSVPSSSVACWSFKVFVSRLLHCTHPPRASQNGKEERKLWSCQPCKFCFVLL